MVCNIYLPYYCKTCQQQICHIPKLLDMDNGEVCLYMPHVKSLALTMLQELCTQMTTSKPDDTGWWQWPSLITYAGELVTWPNQSKSQSCCQFSYGSSKGCYECGFINFVECIIGSNMALYINFNHTLHYHMDAFRLTMFGHIYFISPDYLVV